MNENANGTVNCEFMIDNAERRKSLFATNVAVIVLNSVFALTATFQNMPVIYAILRTPTLHNPANILLCSLASTDLLVGCIIQPLYIGHTATLLDDAKPFSCSTWKAKESLLLLFMYVSISTLVMISTERWLALHYHLRYHQVVSVRRTLFAIALTWFFSTASIVAWPAGLDMHTFTLIGITAITIAAILLVFMYVKIFLILRHHITVIDNQAKLNPSSMNIRKHRKSSATMLYVVVLFFIFYAPTFYAMIHYLDSESKDASVEQTILWEIAKTVALINASANPLMYYWKMRDIRRAVRSVFGISSIVRVTVGDGVTPASGSRENEFRSRTDQRQGSFSARPSSRGAWSNAYLSKSKSDIHEDHGTETTEVKDVNVKVREKKFFPMPRFLEPGPSFRE